MFARLHDRWKIFRQQPVVCRVLWCLLWAGAALAWAGYFQRVPWQSISGLSLVAAVYGLALLGMKWRPERFGKFAGGLFVILLIGVPVFLLFLAITSVVIVVAGLLHGFTLAAVLQGLHFTALMAGCSGILSLPTAMRSAGSGQHSPELRRP